MKQKMCSSRKYPYIPHGRFFVLLPPFPPGNSSLASYFASKILASKTPLPLGISDDLPWGRYVFFLELHNQPKIQHKTVLLSALQLEVFSSCIFLKREAGRLVSLAAVLCRGEECCATRHKIAARDTTGRQAYKRCMFFITDITKYLLASPQ